MSGADAAIMQNSRSRAVSGSRFPRHQPDMMWVCTCTLASGLLCLVVVFARWLHRGNAVGHPAILERALLLFRQLPDEIRSVPIRVDYEHISRRPIVLALDLADLGRLM